MDCLTAQGLISDALDREPVDAIQLAEAKGHCAGCKACSVFVRTQLIAKNVPAPAPHANLVDRVMVAIRAEHAISQETAAAAARISAVATIAGDTASPDPALSDTASRPETNSSPVAIPARVAPVVAVKRWVSGLSRQEMVTWASAAAIFVAALGIGTIAGVRVLTNRPTPRSSVTFAGSVQNSAADSLAAAAPESYGAAGSKQAVPAVSAGSYITVQGAVFTLSGPSTIATEGLKPAGSVATALGTGGSPTSHALFSASDPDRIYLADANQQLLAFDRVVRTFSGSTYQLMSADLTAYGQWPTLPSSIAPPTAGDGSPTFLPLADDALGTKVYRLSASGAETGIGVGPGTASGDPAAGNPNWTWWARIP